MLFDTLFRKSAKPPSSSLGFAKKTSSLRDHPRHTAEIWLQGKRQDDAIEANLWRVHDSLYDFAEFIQLHPGGRDWLELTKGSDITEAFESHHIRPLADEYLRRFFVRRADTRRNSPFTFADDGFYRTLKRRVRPLLIGDRHADGNTYQLSKMYADGMFATYLILAIMAAKFDSASLAVLAGIVLSMSTIIAHNFFHQRDNFRMWYFDFSMMSSRAWRVTHALSHHIYTNTVYDYEISFVEPFFQFLSVEKTALVRYGSWIYGPLIYVSTFTASYVRMLLQVNEDGWNTFRKEALLPFTVPLLMYTMSNATILRVAVLFLVIVMIGGTHFSVIGINAAHHHPDIFHDGDIPRKEDLDWGLHQLDAVADRKDINTSLFLILTNFGDHCLHHLFPTLDHGQLAQLLPTVIEVCKEFDSEMTVKTQIELVTGQYLQLARQKPNDKRRKAVESGENK